MYALFEGQLAFSSSQIRVDEDARANDRVCRFTQLLGGTEYVGDRLGRRECDQERLDAPFDDTTKPATAIAKDQWFNGQVLLAKDSEQSIV